MNNGQDGWQTAREMARPTAAAAAAVSGRRFSRGSCDPGDIGHGRSQGREGNQQDGDAYVADLTEDGAKSLASPFGRGRRGGGGGGGGSLFPEVTDAKGTVKCGSRTASSARYQFKVTGKTTNRDDPVDLDRTTTVEIKDIGSTKINVPDDVLKKIGG